MGPVKAIDSNLMRGNFSSHARDYDSYASVQKRVVDILCDAMSDLVPLRGVFLDVGTGTGALAVALRNDSQIPQLIVMDIAHGMTSEAAQRLPGCRPCDGDARTLPFKGDAFSGVVSSSVYQWVDCLPSAFAEVARVLVPDGYFAMALFGEKTLFELRDSHRQASVSQQGRNSHVQTFPTKAEVVGAIESAGLNCHLVSSSMEVEYHRDVPDLLRQLKQIGASNASADRPKGLASRRIMLSMMELYEKQYRSEKGLPASYEVIVVIAQKKKAASRCSLP